MSTLSPVLDKTGRFLYIGCRWKANQQLPIVDDELGTLTRQCLEVILEGDYRFLSALSGLEILE